MALILGAMAAARTGIASADHKGEASGEGEVLKLGYSLMLRVWDNVSDLGAASIDFRDSGAGSGKEGLIGDGRHSGGEVRA